MKNYSSSIQGKIPPQNLEAEKEILGSILLNSEKLEDVFDILNTEDVFYAEHNKIIFSAIRDLHFSGSQVDTITLSEELIKRGKLDEIGGHYALAMLSDVPPTTLSKLMSHSLIVKEKYIKREIVRQCSEAMAKAYSDSDDVFQLLDEFEESIGNLSEQVVNSDMKNVDEIYLDVVQKMERDRKDTRELSGIPSGSPKLDLLTNGWQKTDLIILAARPAVGKTAFALNLALSAVVNNGNPVNVAFFSLEMGRDQLMKRLMANHMDIELNEIKRPRYLSAANWDKILNCATIGNSRIYIEDKSGINPIQMKNKVKSLMRKEKRLKGSNSDWMIIVDYMQLMRWIDEKKMNREQIISNISRTLKGIAKDLDVPVIALSQLSRELEKRGGDAKSPQLSDLRESGAIEQDADMVCFLYRPEYHGITTDESGESLEGLTILSIAKHRNGELDTIKFKSELSKQRFTDLDLWNAQYSPMGFSGSGRINPDYNINDDDLRLSAPF